MKRLLLYIIALMLLPQVAFAAVLVGKTEGAFSVSPSGAAKTDLANSLPPYH